MNDNLTGSCLCELVSYQFNQPALKMGICHCRDCQKWTGCAAKPYLVFPADAMQVTGDVKFYTKFSARGSQASRGFCVNCGGEVYAKSTGYPGIVIISAGTLDNPELFKPSVEIFTDSACHWSLFLGDTDKFLAYP
ncbi:MAG: GFA family protein [Francisellaceae bacterium]